MTLTQKCDEVMKSRSADNLKQRLIDKIDSLELNTQELREIDFLFENRSGIMQVIGFLKSITQQHV